MSEDQHHLQEGCCACPFCGSTNLQPEWNYATQHGALTCLSCGTRGPSASTLSKAKVRWNKRHIYSIPMQERGSDE